MRAAREASWTAPVLTPHFPHVVRQDRGHGSAMGQPRRQRRSCDHPTTSEQTLVPAGYPTRCGGLALDVEVPAFRYLALLVAGPSAGLPGRCAGARSAAGPESQDRAADPVASTA